MQKCINFTLIIIVGSQFVELWPHNYYYYYYYYYTPTNVSAWYKPTQTKKCIFPKQNKGINSLVMHSYNFKK